MDYDFFENEQDKKEAERVPTPSVSSGKPSEIVPVRKKKIPWWVALISVGGALLFFLTGYLVSWLTLDSQLRTLLKVKEQIQNNYYEEVTDERFYQAIFGGINDNLLDPYSRYMTPEEFALYTSDLQGSRIGIGLVFDEGEDLRIMRVCGNSPAEKAGILAGEKVLGCGATQEGVASCVDFNAFSAAIEGYGENEEFFVQIEAASGEKRVVRVSKQEYVESLVFYRTNNAACTFDERGEEQAQGAPLVYLDGDTAYIRLIQFTGNASRDFAKAMSRFQADGKKNLILDLRGNVGGLLDIMQDISGYFCKSTTEREPIVAIADYGEKRVEYRAKENVCAQYFSADSRICVLADINSASASECLIGSMIDYGALSFSDICLIERGGTARTYGKGIMQETYFVTLGNQDALKLTTAKILWPSGRSIHEVGVRTADGAVSVPNNRNFEEETKAAIEKLFPAQES